MFTTRFKTVPTLTPLLKFQFRTNVSDLRPQVAKARKTSKGYFKLHQGGSLQGTVPVFGQYALIADEGGKLKDFQIDAARSMLRQALKSFKEAKFQISSMPDRPFTSKGAEARMGKGKGAIDYWGIWVAKGKVLFEVQGLTEQAAKRALTVAGSALHIRTSVIQASDQPNRHRVVPYFIKKRLDMQQFVAFQPRTKN